MICYCHDAFFGISYKYSKIIPNPLREGFTCRRVEGGPGCSASLREALQDLPPRSDHQAFVDLVVADAVGKSFSLAG